jgi:nuclear GTP-binding protein
MQLKFRRTDSLTYDQVGKSSFVNSVFRQPVFPIYSVERATGGPSTTEVAQETIMDVDNKQIRWIDTPGLVWEAGDSATSSEVRAHDILLRCRGRIDRLKDPSMASTFFLDFVETRAYLCQQ